MCESVRQKLGHTTIWLGTYEYMKSTLWFFQIETGLPEWIFQIWSKIFKSNPVFVYMKKSLF
jgi:hypothetical protein